MTDESECISVLILELIDTNPLPDEAMAGTCKCLNCDRGVWLRPRDRQVLEDEPDAVAMCTACIADFRAFNPTAFAKALLEH
jgi:hypothetical protein